MQQKQQRNQSGDIFLEKFRKLEMKREQKTTSATKKQKEARNSMPINKISARAAVYARYSSDMQSADSADDQIARIRYRLDHGQIRSQKHFGNPIEICNEWVKKDEAQSGRIASRDGYEAILNGIRSKSFDIIIVDDLSRLTRSLGNLLGLYDMLKWYEVELISICDGISSEDPSAKTFFTVKGMVNDFSNDIHAERVIRGMEMRVLNGLSCGDYPYGYDSVATKFENAKGKPAPSHFKIEINEAEAQIIRRIFQMYNIGLGYSRIAKALNEDKLPSPSASYAKAGRFTSWSSQSVQNIIRNEKYIGIWRWKKTKIGINPESKTKSAKDRPTTEWVSHNGSSDIREDLKIIDQENWELAQKRLSENKRFPTSERQKGRWANRGLALPDHPFSGLLECGVCHSNFSLISGKRGGYYGCNSAHRKGTCKNKKIISADRIAEEIISVIRKDLVKPEILKDAVKRYNQVLLQKTSSAPQRMKQIEQELGLIEQELHKLVQVIISGNPSETVNFAIKEREDRKIRLKSERSSLSKTNLKSSPETIESVTKRLEGLKETITENPLRCYPILRTMFPRKIKMIPHYNSESMDTDYLLDGGIYLNAAMESSFVIEVKGKKNGDAKSHPHSVPVFPFLNESNSENCVSDSHRFDLFKNGVTDGARTRDTRNHNPVLYQLNYGHHILS